MILAGKLKQMLQKVPDDAKVNAYEGEDVGIVIWMPDGSVQFIRAMESDKEDIQKDFHL